MNILFILLFTGAFVDETVGNEVLTQNFSLSGDSSTIVIAKMDKFILNATKQNKAIGITITSENPVTYKIIKCASSIFKSIVPVVQDTFVIKNKWFDFLTESVYEGCPGSRFRIEFQSDLKTNGIVTFFLADKTHGFISSGTHDYHPMFHLTQIADITGRYSIKLKDTLERAIIGGTLSISMKLNSSVLLGFAKCNIKVVIPTMVFENKWKIRMAKGTVKYLHLLTELSCPEDPTDSFDTLLTTRKAVTGSMEYSVVTESSFPVLTWALVFFPPIACLLFVAYIVIKKKIEPKRISPATNGFEMAQRF